MRTKNSHEQPEVEGGAVKRPAHPFYVVECDAFELPQFKTDLSLIPERNRAVHKRIGFGEQDGGYEWKGGLRNWKQAEDLLYKGWPEGVAQAAKLAERITQKLPAPESLRRRPVWTDDGDELDRDKLYTSGVEGAFRHTRQLRSPAPRAIRIVKNWSISCHYSAEQIAWNGASLVALVDILERADYQTEISLGCPGSHYGGGNGHIGMPVIRVKHFSEPANLSTLASVAGHAGIFRSYGFCAITSTPYQVDSGLGFPLGLRQSWEDGIAAGVLEPVDTIIEQCYDEAGATAGLVKALREIFKDAPELLAALDEYEKERA